MGYPLAPDETIDMLSRQIGEWAQSKGFREDWEMADGLDAFADSMLVQLRLNSEDCGWLHKVADSLRNNIVAAKLALIHSEVSEALETWRDTGYVGHTNGLGNLMEELADAEIRIKELAHMVGGGLGAAETAKMHKNHGRPHKHGRKM